MQLEVVLALEQEEAALAGRVGRLQHRREADPLRGRRAPRAACAPRRTPAAARRARRARGAWRSCWSSGAPRRGRCPGRPSSSATAATIGTARSAATVMTPSTAWRRPTSTTASTSGKSTTSPHVGDGEPRRVRRCGRRRRRARRARARARSRAAGAGPRRRRGASARSRRRCYAAREQMPGDGHVRDGQVLGAGRARPHGLPRRRHGRAGLETDGEVWREDRMAALLAEATAARSSSRAASRTRARFYDRFDAVVLLSAPADVMLERIARARTTAFGKSSEERARDPRPTWPRSSRSSAPGCTHEIDAGPAPTSASVRRRPRRALGSPRGPARKARADHRRRRFHRHDPRAPARRREQVIAARQPAPRRARGHRPRRAPELRLPPGATSSTPTRSASSPRARRTSSTARRSPASTPSARAPCGRCA